MLKEQEWDIRFAFLFTPIHCAIQRIALQVMFNKICKLCFSAVQTCTEVLVQQSTYRLC